MIKNVCQVGFRAAIRLGAAVVLVFTAPTSFAHAQQSRAASASESAATQTRPAGANPPQWDVVSVRPANPQECAQGADAGMRTTTDGVNIFCVPLLFAIQQAYQIHDASRILNAPGWVNGPNVWQIDAKVAGDDVAAFHNLNREEHMGMLRPLLADRFHLKAHIEQRQMPIYELVVGKSGLKLKEATADETGNAHMVIEGAGKIDAARASLAGLPGLLSREVGRLVVDKTGLTGKYDFTLEYVPATKAATDESGGPSIFTALEEQLGLKLEPAKAPMDVLVIDSIEQPTAN